MQMDWTVVANIASILLAVYAILFARREAKKSKESYEATKSTLKEIEFKSETIDRAVQVQQAQLVEILNKALDKIGAEPIELTPISKDEIEAIFSRSVHETIEKKEKEISKELSRNRYLRQL